MARHNYGEPYDPALRQTEHGSKLYQCWRTVRKNQHTTDWDYFPAFYEWAMQNGYQSGAWLQRNDPDKPYEPGNCAWHIPEYKKNRVPKEWADGWNKTVNRIRKHYGMPPLRGTEYVD